ncbi:MAG TPA: galactokinase, partial [Pyrinomonadaceae bacterium]|nr:galactokinase [Pyrinomonadaceae bacterium]
MDTGQLRREFSNRFDRQPRIFRAPGRVNLIGEHTDYNDGFVMPAAIDFAAYVAISPRSDRVVKAASLNYPGECEFSLDGVIEPLREWGKYVQGSALTLDRLRPIRGADILIDSDVPIGSGLSSSAALEVAIAFAISEVAGASLDKWDLVRIGQTTEHEFADVKGGIMDQFASAFGIAGHALFLDCRSREWEPLTMPSSFVICNTKTKHDLAESEYNKRRAECEEAAALFGRTSLRDVALAEFKQREAELPDHLRKRARHVLTENARVKDAANAMRRDDMTEVGRLIDESHESLRADFEVSCFELDTMVRIVRKHAGVIGSRMIGGGFGGCAIGLFEHDVPP